MVRYLCELVSVSSLGYCRYFSEEVRRNKQAREKAAKKHRTLPNLWNREFKQEIARKGWLTDLTYLSYGKGKRAYLSTIKDAETDEILAYETSDKITLDIALNTLKKLKSSKMKLAGDAFIHSNQGFHNTSPPLQKKVKEM